MTSKLTRGIERNQTRPFSEIDSGRCLRVDYKKTVANFAKLISKMNSGPRSASNRRKSKLSWNSPLRRSSCAVQYINTAPANERCFLVKSLEKINDLPDSSTDIESDNVIKRYQRRPCQLENICLADFVAWYEVLPSGKSDSLNSTQIWSDCLPDNDSLENHDDDTVIEEDIVPSSKSYKQPGGLKLVKRKKSKVLRSVRYDKSKDSENYHRERLMLYVPWRNENKNLLQDSQTFEEHFLKMKSIIDKTPRSDFFPGFGFRSRV